MDRDANRRRFVGLVIGVLAGALVAALLAGAIVAAQIRGTQLDRLPQVEQNDETLQIVKDCTQVGGKCYQRGQRQTAAILTSAQKIIILSAACSLDVDAAQSVEERVQQITGCVTQRLARTTVPTQP